LANLQHLVEYHKCWHTKYVTIFSHVMAFIFSRQTQLTVEAMAKNGTSVAKRKTYSWN